MQIKRILVILLLSAGWVNAGTITDAQITELNNLKATLQTVIDGIGPDPAACPDPIPDPPPAPPPSDIDSMVAGTWMEVPNSNLSAVYPLVQPTGNPAAIMNAWGGGAYDTTRNRLMVWGGGHGDYSGNELYAFDILTLSWVRVTDPSTDVSETGTGAYTDGNPRSTHTYDTLQYIAATDSLLAVGMGGTYQIGNASRNMFSLNLATNTWSSPGDVPYSGEPGAGATAYDPSTGYVYGLSGVGWKRLNRYDPVNNTWVELSQYDDEVYLEYQNKAAIDPVRQIMVSIGKYGFLKWDLATGASTYNPAVPDITTVNPPALETSSSAGFVFNPDKGVFVGWDGGANLYELDPATWTWTQVSLDPSNTVIPTAAEPNGTFGRFQYIPDYKVYIVVNSTTGNVFIFKS